MGSLDPEQRRFISIAITDLLICASIVLVILCQSAQNKRLEAIVERSEALHTRLKSAADSSHTFHRQIRAKQDEIYRSVSHVESLVQPKSDPKP